MTVTRKNLFTIVTSALLVGNMATAVSAMCVEPVPAPSLQMAAIRVLEKTPEEFGTVSSLNSNEKGPLMQFVANITKICAGIDEPIIFFYKEDLTYNSFLTQCIAMLEMADSSDEIDEDTIKKLEITINSLKKIALEQAAYKSIIRNILSEFSDEINQRLEELDLRE